jgi:hypothetical protein
MFSSVDCFIFYILFRNVFDKQFLDSEKSALVLAPLAKRCHTSSCLRTSTNICISSYDIRFCYIAIYEVNGRIFYRRCLTPFVISACPRCLRVCHYCAVNVTYYLLVVGAKFVLERRLISQIRFVTVSTWFRLIRCIVIGKWYISLCCLNFCFGKGILIHVCVLRMLLDNFLRRYRRSESFTTWKLSHNSALCVFGLYTYGCRRSEGFSIRKFLFPFARSVSLFQKKKLIAVKIKLQRN